jgi:uncharacterized membrane protein
MFRNGSSIVFQFKRDNAFQATASENSAAVRRGRDYTPKIARIFLTNTRMEWGQALILFGLACFWAVVLFMVLRKSQGPTSIKHG